MQYAITISKVDDKTTDTILIVDGKKVAHKSYAVSKDDYEKATTETLGKLVRRAISDINEK